MGKNILITNMILTKKTGRHVTTKIFFIVSFLCLAGFIFNFNIPTAEAFSYSSPEGFRDSLMHYLWLFLITFSPLFLWLIIFIGGPAAYSFLHDYAPPYSYYGPPFYFYLLFYIYLTVCLIFLARKTKTPHCWMALAPVLNIYLLCKIAGKPGWWTGLYFLPAIVAIYLGSRPFFIWHEPTTNGIALFRPGPGIAPFSGFIMPGIIASFIFFLVILLLMWRGVAKRTGRRGFLGILMVIPLFNLIVMGFLAFSKKKGEGVSKPT